MAVTKTVTKTIKTTAAKPAAKPAKPATKPAAPATPATPATPAPPATATTAVRLAPAPACTNGWMRVLIGIAGLLVVALLVGLFYGARAIGSYQTTTGMQAKLDESNKAKEVADVAKQAAEKDAKQATEDAKKALPPAQGIKAGNASETTVSAVASIEGTTDAVKGGANVSTFIRQASKIDDECPAKKVSTSVTQSIEMRGGNDGVTYEQGEADKRRAEGQALIVNAKAKMEEVKAKYGLVKREALPPITVKVEGHVDVGGNVGMDGNVKMDGNVEMSGEIHHTGEIVHAGFIRHDGSVVHSGEIKIVGTIDGKITGAITIDGKTKKVCWDPCNRQWVEVQ